ncbi:HAD-superfamily hydrolase [Cinnamomum micranthum f. kanehirae]|uniref:HAD-superfamily hydrolase n=1 Tax=Cinnamomum micranthum f. kanehirae TaxID=337451 RepID=A0A443NNP4_9MAGN|nr:HAD-superfamily hydrolase [Cinnamomum micranthum f. kanehirae]
MCPLCLSEFQNSNQIKGTKEDSVLSKSLNFIHGRQAISEMLSTPVFALKSGPQIAQPFVSFVTKSRSECRMVGKSSISGGEVQVLESLNGIRHLAETGRFKAWFLDQFGVLHDGKHPYPVEKLASYGAKMVIISNSSRRASTTIEKLKSLGFDTSLFFGAITSGELTHQYLQRRDDSWFATLGRSCIHMTWSDRGAISLEVSSLPLSLIGGLLGG